MNNIKKNILVVFLVIVVILSCVIYTSFSVFTYNMQGKNSISLSAKVVDNIPPSCGSVVGESTTWTKDNRQISVTCNDNKECEKSVYVTTFDKTTKTANVVIKDKAGNSTNCPVNVYVDKTAPSCGSVTGASTSWTKDNRTISVACSDADSTCSKTSFSNTFSTTTKTSNITISDAVGNTTNCPVNVYVDKTAPTCGTITGASTTWTSADRTISVACSDSHSLCSKSSFSKTYTTTTQTDNITISDNVGNTTSCPVNVYVRKATSLKSSILGENNSNVVTSGNGLLYGYNTSMYYYYKGNVTNNYVKFADMMWRVVRVDENGSIRLVLEDGINGNTAYPYASSSNMSYYMYYSSNPSYIKKTVEDWYSEKLNSYDSMVVESTFCEQAKVKPFSTFSGESSMVVKDSYNASIACKNDGNGKGILTLKVGLLSVDELLQAGVLFSGTTNSYLNKDYAFWSMSPAGYGDGAGSVWYAGYYNFISYYKTTGNMAVRPVINIKGDVLATGSGTSSDPYVVLN